jgi:hypothetical protein
LDEERTCHEVTKHALANLQQSASTTTSSSSSFSVAVEDFSRADANADVSADTRSDARANARTKASATVKMIKARAEVAALTNRLVANEAQLTHFQQQPRRGKTL